ncbi:MAG: UDP-3-O-[3-hydroxymyristoyl] N-acetylglucosamine deacetylase [Alphaproteobacteria bacterium]|nr:UDP-3-O-[3-hydroxymyristoyl] N-acetylglucosamine deacetylase [Alphaproteobacteria bacterium]
MQQTIAREITITGVGLHSGANSTITLKPASENTGIMFKRIDIKNTGLIKGTYDNVVDTKNCTCLGDKSGNIISTIEHLMAALAVLQIDNLQIEINSPEMPIMDGSASIFLEELEKAGIKKQNSPRRYIKVLKEIEFSDDKGNKVSLSPDNNFSVHFTIEFPSKIVGHQEFNDIITKDIFAKEIAPCRTFCEKYQIDYLRSIGLIKGGSLDNAVVLDGEKIMNPDGFKVPNECVNHKVLDAIGDMYTAGLPIIGRLTATKTGHFHNNQILKVLFADETNYEII